MGDQLIGMAAGRKKDILVKIPENYSANKTIASKEVNFHISLKGIQENQLPAIDDDFAKNIEPKNKFDSVSEYETKNSLRT